MERSLPYIMETTIKQIEDMSLNAWPSHKMELYDGWILRFSYFYTHRTNSVEQFGNSTLTWREKIPYCESVYKRLGTPAVFKISPLVSPDFDYVLENRGYAIQHTTNVMAMSMHAARLDAPYPDVTFCDNIPSEWIESLFLLKNTDHRNRTWHSGQRLYWHLCHPCQGRIPQTWLCPSDLHRTSERRNEKRCTECISSGCRGK